MNKKISPALIIIIIVIIAILGLATYLVIRATKKSSTQQTSIPTAQTPSQATSEEIRATDEQANIEAVKKVIQDFEKLQQQKQALQILAKMTEPQTSQEIEARDFILGYDIDPSGQGFRLYSTSGMGYELESFKIGECQSKDTGYVCSVEESRKYWDNVEGQWTEPQTKTYNFTVIKQNNQWLIDKYTDPTSESDIEKYSGFGA